MRRMTYAEGATSTYGEGLYQVETVFSGTSALAGGDKETTIMEGRGGPMRRGRHRTMGRERYPVCKFYRRRRCTRYFCPFLHTDLVPRVGISSESYGSSNTKSKSVWSRLRDQNSSYSSNNTIVEQAGVKFCGSHQTSNHGSGSEDQPKKLIEKSKVVDCQFPRFDGDSFSMLSNLGGHSKALSGIALPSHSDKLFSASSDGIVRIWDCHTGKTVQIINTGGTIGSLISKGPWIFIGMRDMVKAWNLESGAEFNLNGPVKKVQSMIVARDMLFAGAQSGTISVWKAGAEIPNFFQLVASLKGHTGAVSCLAAGDNMFYSGGIDSSIKVWSLDTLQCVHKLTQHTDSVMSFIWCDQYLLSSSFDQTIKVWSCTEGDKPPEVIYTHKENEPIIALSGTNDGEGKPILLCSSLDARVRLYELPSFTERGQIISQIKIKRVEVGPHGLFFTGDANGMLTVWKMAEACPSVTSLEANKSG